MRGGSALLEQGAALLCVGRLYSAGARQMDDGGVDTAAPGAVFHHSPVQVQGAVIARSQEEIVAAPLQRHRLYKAL